MKEVKIYRPQVKETQDGKSFKREIVKKKGTFVKKIAVMDRTFALFENADDDYIINHDMHMEEVKDKAKDEPAPAKEGKEPDKDVKSEKPKGK